MPARWQIFAIPPKTQFALALVIVYSLANFLVAYFFGLALNNTVQILQLT